MLELMKRHLAAYASGDWDAYKADLAPDVQYEEVATGATASGIDAYLDAVRKWKTGFPDLGAKIERFYAVDDVAVAEITWEGTHRGSLDTPFGTLPPTNKSGRVRAVLISKITDGKIAETRHFFDLMTVMRQIQAAAATRPEAEAAQPAVH